MQQTERGVTLRNVDEDAERDRLAACFASSFAASVRRPPTVTEQLSAWPRRQRRDRVRLSDDVLEEMGYRLRKINRKWRLGWIESAVWESLV